MPLEPLEFAAFSAFHAQRKPMQGKNVQMGNQVSQLCTREYTKGYNNSWYGESHFFIRYTEMPAAIREKTTEQQKQQFLQHRQAAEQQSQIPV
mmetsp:Transcript_22214/g.40329  ORF Transcript_22214/g.40329 Transcript_22214/m.40329 type:complete len:93 (+) Transcript_22214:214-492(+)